MTDTISVHISTYKGKLEAILDKSDYDILKSKGFIRSWFVNSANDVIARIRGKNTIIARVLLGIEGDRSKLATYKDGNKLNLVRDNLVIKPAGNRFLTLRFANK